MDVLSLHPNLNRPPAGAHEIPRIIIWQIAPGGNEPQSGKRTVKRAGRGEPLNTTECMLVIDSIARTAKPIVVLSGDGILDRYPRLTEILDYGRALGLKMIVEVTPAELTEDVVSKYSRFGGRIFRVKIGDPTDDLQHDRMEDTPRFDELEAALDRLESHGYESHVVFTATRPDIRTLAILHDYAVRRSVRGLYCHMRFGQRGGGGARNGHGVDEFIGRFATMKEYSPSTMIISPQCVKFVPNGFRYGRAGQAGGSWDYSCLGGKSFAFIDEEGRVRPCGSSGGERTTLRDTGYDFRNIWMHATSFTDSRAVCRNCLHGHHAHTRDGVDRSAPTDSAPGVAGGISSS